MIAGGCESMSMVPMMATRRRSTRAIFDGDENIGIAYGMGLTAEKVAAQWKVRARRRTPSRYLLAPEGAGAQAAGAFADEIAAGGGRPSPDLASGEVVTARAPPPPTKGACRHHAGRLAKLRPVFAPPPGQRDAGNSSQMSDGAGALILVSERAEGSTFGLAPRALVSYAVARRAAEDHGASARRRRSRRAEGRRFEAGRPGWIELNEAFAAQAWR